MTLDIERIRRLETLRYVCVGGGGTYGFAFEGIILFLSEHMLDFKAWMRKLQGAAGSSVGSLVALLLCCEVMPKTVLDVWSERVPVDSLSSGFDVNLLYKNYGSDDGANLRSIISGILQICGIDEGATMKRVASLIKKEFMCYATNLSTVSPYLMSAKTTPDLPIGKALYMSMTVPFIFKPEEHEGSLYVDGCLTKNVPYGLFESEETLFLFLRGDTFIDVHSFSSFAYAVLTCNVSSQLSHLGDMNLPHKIEMSAPRSNTFLMKIDKRRIVKLVSSGYVQAAVAFIPGLLDFLITLLRILVSTITSDSSTVQSSSARSCADETANSSP
jgi:predicted acylesterase/phospholipase RssA